MFLSSQNGILGIFFLLLRCFQCTESIMSAVMLSPSSRAYICSAGDILELTCNTTESALQWSLTWTGMIDPIYLSISSTSIIIPRGMINTSRIAATRISERGETPLISTLEINPVIDSFNGTLNITCRLLGPLASMETTTIHFADPIIYLNPPLIVMEEEFGMDYVVIGLHWLQQNYKNLLVIYNVSIVPIINAESVVSTAIHMISNTRANLTVPYNTPYNVSVVAELCGSQATTQINIHYAACEEPLVSDINPQDHDNVSLTVLMVSGLGYGRPSLEGEIARLSCLPPELVRIGPNVTTCTGNGRWEPDPREVACKANCSAPLIPNVARIFPYSNTLEGAIVAYSCHGDSNHVLAAICSNRGIWEPNLSQICTHDHYSGTRVQLSRDGKVAVASSVSVFVIASILFFIAGFLCHHICQTSGRSNKNEPEIPTNYKSENSGSPGPLYDNVLLNQHNSEPVELKENVAYGPINPTTIN